MCETISSPIKKISNLKTTKRIVTIVSFLLGIKKFNLKMDFDNDTLAEIENDKDAKVIRYLSKLRTTLFYNFKSTDESLRGIFGTIKNLESIECFDKENIKWLRENGMEIVKANYTSEKYMFDISKAINDNIEKCSHLFPEWVNWEYIKSLFTVPKIKTKSTLKGEFDKFMGNYDFYPYQQYMYWNEPYNCGSLVHTDGKFLQLLYEWNGDVFNDYSKITDASTEVKENIYDFIDKSESIEIVVDCENADVYKLYGTLKNLKNEEVKKIKRIVLYNDVNTNRGWDWLGNFLNIPVITIDVERVVDRKSLVDIMVTAGVCKDYYERTAKSFILVSSDSDYWGLIRTLPDADFLVLYEEEKYGTNIKNIMENHGYYYACIDDFCTGNIDDLKKIVLIGLLKEKLPNIFGYNLKELVKELYKESRIQASETEMNNFYNKYIKTLKFSVDENGKPSLEVKK